MTRTISSSICGACAPNRSKTISGRWVDVRLSPDMLDALIDALDGLDQPLNGWKAHEALRRHLSVAYDISQE